MSVRIGVGLGQGVWPPKSTGPDFLWEFIDRCENSPIDSIWTSDRIVGPAQVLEPMTVLSAVAARSKRLKFGTSVLALPLRNPVVLAKEIATLDYISKGRMLPAVGLGTENEAEYIACGVRKQERAGRTDEAIPLLRRLWLEDHVTHHGHYYRCDDVIIEPKPAQKPPPIWVGGRSEPALRRTARLSDGWLVAGVSPAETAEAVPQIFRYAEEYGRNFDRGHIGLILSFCIAETSAKAWELAQSGNALLRRRTDIRADDYSAIGTPKEVIAKFKAYVAAGASKFVARPACQPDHIFQQLDLLSRQVIPYVHD